MKLEFGSRCNKLRYQGVIGIILEIIEEVPIARLQYYTQGLYYAVLF